MDPTVGLDTVEKRKFLALPGLESGLLGRPARSHSLYRLSYPGLGRTVAKAVSCWLPTAVARVRVRAACGVCGGQSGTGAGFSPSTSVSPGKHSTNVSIIIITRDWDNTSISGRSAEWTNFGLHPNYTKLKKINK
jgi:hypothetical protein